MDKDEKRQLQRKRLMDSKAYQTMQGLTRYMDRLFLCPCHQERTADTGYSQ